MKDLVFKDLRTILDEVVPGDVAQVGVDNTLGGSFTDMAVGFDADMCIYKGIVAGALASLSATEIAYVNTDEAPDGFIDYDWNEQDPKWDAESSFISYPPSEEHEYGWERGIEYNEILARIYFGHDKPDGSSMIDLSTPSVRAPEGVETGMMVSLAGGGVEYYTEWGYHFEARVDIYRNAFQMNPTGDLYAPGTFWVHVVHTQMVCEGGPPTDFFFVKSQGLD